MKEFIKGNKLVSVILGFLFTSIITYNVLWGTWVTNQVYFLRGLITSHAAVQVVDNKNVSQQIKEVKDEVRGVKDELANVKKEVGEEGIKLRKDITDNQKELLKLLIEIKKK